jgi:hypothetical protein
MTAAGPAAAPPTAARPAAPPAIRPPPRPADRPGAQRGQESAPVFVPAADIWRRWRIPLAIIAVVLIGGTVIALLKPAPPAIGYLDPSGTGPFGSRALAVILSGHGHQVIRTVTPAAAAAEARQASSTLVITSPGYLTRRQLDALEQVPGPVVIVEPDKAALAVIAPDSALAKGTPFGGTPVGPVQPRCALSAAQLAGNADMGGLLLRLRLRPGVTGAALCYPAFGLPSLVRYSAGGRLITLLGTGEPLTNAFLGQLGNAALALNLLGTSPRVVWLVPAPAIVAGAGPAGGRKSLTSLLPLGADLVAIQLCIALVLAALWRARRLGPLVAEQLPVVIRASETVEGHSRLYQSRRARDRAAAALRTAMLRRVMPAVGLARGAHPGAITAALAARSGLGTARIEMMLFGPAPASDTALVTLADDLDALEREVRAQ